MSCLCNFSRTEYCSQTGKGTTRGDFWEAASVTAGEQVFYFSPCNGAGEQLAGQPWTHCLLPVHQAAGSDQLWYLLCSACPNWHRAASPQDFSSLLAGSQERQNLKALKGIWIKKGLFDPAVCWQIWALPCLMGRTLAPAVAVSITLVPASWHPKGSETVTSPCLALCLCLCFNLLPAAWMWESRSHAVDISSPTGGQCSPWYGLPQGWPCCAAGCAWPGSALHIAAPTSHCLTPRPKSSHPSKNSMPFSLPRWRNPKEQRAELHPCDTS